MRKKFERENSEKKMMKKLLQPKLEKFGRKSYVKTFALK